MADITMCKNEECLLKEQCYRYKVTPDGHQSYFEEPKKLPKDEDGKCIFFWKIKAKILEKLYEI